jgi:hypothetical protein
VASEWARACSGRLGALRDRRGDRAGVTVVGRQCVRRRRDREPVLQREVVEAQRAIAHREVIERVRAVEPVGGGRALAGDQRVGQILDGARIGQPPRLDGRLELRAIEADQDLRTPELVDAVGTAGVVACCRAARK